MGKGGGGSGRGGAGAKGGAGGGLKAYDIQAQAQAQAIEDDKKLLAKLKAELNSLDDDFAKRIKDIEGGYLKDLEDLKNDIKNNKT